MAQAPYGSTPSMGPTTTAPQLVDQNPGPTNAALDNLQSLVDEMRVQDFDSIRFATYRTACKLRFVQTKTNVGKVGIWDMIEAFRENGLNALPINGNLKMSRLELLLTSIFHNLNKRLPTSQHVDTDRSISLLLSFMLGTYDRQHISRLTVFATKVGLATLCAGKLVDKLRCKLKREYEAKELIVDIFSQISDTSGRMEYDKFAEYLQQVLALPTAVFESPTFGFSEQALQQCFKRDENVNLNRFLDVIMGESCPPVLMWLPLLHRMAAVERVYHPVVCDACQVRSFTGFRYKCQRCTNYQLCQSCFWRGRTSQSHSNEHEMKEYSSYKSPTKQIAHSIHKSLQCVPLTTQKTHQDFDTRPVRPLDLSNIVPVTPSILRHQRPEPITEWSSTLLPGQYGNGNAMDDEHKLIARYAAKLSGRSSYAAASRSLPNTLGRSGLNSHHEERAMIAQLEEENNAMLQEMAALEQQQLLAADPSTTGHLIGLRDRTSELEAKMREKQQLRRDLMHQLENLMSQLNGPGNQKAASHPLNLRPEALNGVGNMVSAAFRQTDGSSSVQRFGSIPLVGQLQGDLLNAADAITSNMSNLVQELDQAAEDSPQENGTHA
ncbi:Dystrobrevin [Aphelenchoides besseyi]|nr:Dystrobrevin [Aphelenchoides besseyi]